MEKAAVLHWLQGVHAASYDATGVEESNGGCFNPDTISHNTSSNPNTSHNQTHSPSKQQPDNLQTQPSSGGLTTCIPRSSLVPSSTFQVPQDPGDLEPTEMVRKLIRSNTLSGGPTGFKSSKKVSKPDLNKNKQFFRVQSMPASDSRLSLQAAVCGPVLPRLIRRNSNSPLPPSNPDIVLPTIDLTKEKLASPRRKLLMKTTSAFFTSTSLKSKGFDVGSVTLPDGAVDVSGEKSTPKSAPVSPDLNKFRRMNCPSMITSLNKKSLSQCDLSILNSVKLTHQISPSPNPTSSDDDSGSNVAEKGGLSDLASSDDHNNLPSDFGSGSASPKLERVLEVSNTEEQVGPENQDTFDAAVDDRSLSGVRTNTQVYKVLSVLDSRESSVVISETSDSVTAAAVSTIDESVNNDTKVCEEVGEEGKWGEEEKERKDDDKGRMGGETSTGREEELLQILTKWYNRGHGEKQDLVRALRLTGHPKSATELLTEENIVEKHNWECKEAIRPDATETRSDGMPHVLPLAKEAVINTSQPTSRPRGFQPRQQTILSPQTRQAHSAPLPPTNYHSSLPPHPHSAPPPPPVSHCSSLSPTLSPESPHVLHPHLPPPPTSHHLSQAPVSLAPLSRKKLAELDKANAFSFDDSSDDILFSKPSKFLFKRNSVHSKTHSRSLSDYSGSFTSSSSQGSRVISPGRHMTSPGLPTPQKTFSHTTFLNKRGLPRFIVGQGLTEAEPKMKQVNISPLRCHSSQFFAVPEGEEQTFSAMEKNLETGTTGHSNKLYCSSDSNPVATSASTYQQILTSLGKASKPLGTARDAHAWTRSSREFPDVPRKE